MAEGKYVIQPDFNSHARVGRDGVYSSEPMKFVDFNSHARVGRDLPVSVSYTDQKNFNSHARVGRDPFLTLGLPNSQISTHTPV